MGFRRFKRSPEGLRPSANIGVGEDRKEVRKEDESLRDSNSSHGVTGLL